jgi:zinc protease
MENPLSNLPIHQYRLSNGLTVFLLQDRTVPLVAIDVNYQVGSKNERAGRTGFAHLFEHLMFQGSRNYNDDYFKPLQDIGGQVNGATSTDRTRYWEVVPAGYLERALWLEADRMGFLLDAMTQERLDNQRSVVQNERRQNYDNRPYGTVWEKTLAVLYPPQHPYSWPTIGSMEDIGAAKLEDVRDFFTTFYSPNNASLAVVGDFELDHAKALIEKLFGAIPPGPPVSRVSRWVPRLDQDIHLEIQDRVQLPRGYATFHTVPLFDPEDAALDVFVQILGGGKTSRLYQKLVYEKQIAQDAVAFHHSSQVAGIMQIVVTPRPGHSLEDVQAAALAELEQALAKGITTRELERTVTTVMADYVRSMQNIGGFGGLADRINAYYHHAGEPDRFKWDLQRYLDLTPDGVMKVARKFLRAPKIIVSVRPLENMAPSESVAATSLDRSVMPGKGDESPFRLPPRKNFTLKNGLKVVLVEHRTLPLVSMNLLIPGGSSMDPVELPGLASMTAALMEEGAGGRSSLQLAEDIEALGAQFDVRASTDASVVILSTLKTRMDEALTLMNDVVTRPDFPPAELERQKTNRKVQLTQLRDQPQYVANEAAQRILFGKHPYGRPGLGTTRGIDSITLEHVRDFWKRTFVPDRATLLVVGDVTRKELEVSLGKTLGKWKGGEGMALDLPAPDFPGQRAIHVIDKPGAAQSVIVVGMPGTDRRTSDFAILEVLNTALGGQFVSRLNLNLREDKGYTYGARSRFDFGRVPGAFTASAPVQTEVTAPALREMLKELGDLSGSRPLEGTELAYSVDSIVNGYSRRFATPGQIASELVDVVLYSLPDDAPERFPDEVRAVTATSVKDAAGRYLDLDRAVIVVVGDRKAVVPELEALGIAPVILLDPDVGTP